MEVTCSIFAVDDGLSEHPSVTQLTDHRMQMVTPGKNVESTRVIVIITRESLDVEPASGHSTPVLAAIGQLLQRALGAMPEAMPSIIAQAIREQLLPPCGTGEASDALDGHSVLDEAVDPQQKGSDESGLSKRELEILECLVNGCSNKVIARRLDIAETTVKIHIRRILNKTRSSNRTQAALWAVNKLDKRPLADAEPVRRRRSTDP